MFRLITATIAAASLGLFALGTVNAAPKSGKAAMPACCQKKDAECCKGHEKHKGHAAKGNCCAGHSAHAAHKGQPAHKGHSGAACCAQKKACCQKSAACCDKSAKKAACCVQGKECCKKDAPCCKKA